MTRIIRVVFQFLIGRLESSRFCVGFLRYKEFQFLIGRLESGKLLQTKKLKKGFQFLIGRLESAISAGLALDRIKVSIPYR